MKKTVQLSALAAALLLATAAFAQTPMPNNNTTGDNSAAAQPKSGEMMTMPNASGNGMRNSPSDATSVKGPTDSMADVNGTNAEPTRTHHRKSKMHSHMKRYMGNAPADNIPTYTNAGSNREAGKANGN